MSSSVVQIYVSITEDGRSGMYRRVLSIRSWQRMDEERIDGLMSLAG